MTTKFIEFNSAYRNRELFPLPSQFEVNISQSGNKGKLDALDPVSNASPILVWRNFRSIGGLIISPVVPPSNTGNNTFQIRGFNLNQTRSYYVGATLFKNMSSYNVGRTITEYLPLNSNNAIIKVDNAIPSDLVGKDGWEIYNPTPFNTYTPGINPLFYIPGSNSLVNDVVRTQTYGLGSDNYYINYRIQNTDTGLSRKIISFNASKRLATLDAPTINPDTGAYENWSIRRNNFVIRKEDPIDTGYVKYAINNIIQIFSTKDSNNTSFKTDRINGDFLRIRPYVGAPTYPPPINEERRICKFVYGEGAFTEIIGNPATAVCLDDNAPLENDAYKLCILTVYTPGIINIYEDSTLITYYGTQPGNPSCKRYAEFNTPIVILPAQKWIIRTVILCDPFTVTPPYNLPLIRYFDENFELLNPNALYEVEQFTRDNATPFSYNGSLLNTSQPTCYDVELVNLILPNVTLASGRGGRPVFYPYLYVELHQVSANTGPDGTNGILSSNNPNAFRMLFRAILSDTAQPEFSPYIKIDGDWMTHTIKFKPTDNFKFGVYHSNGEPLKFTIDEQYSPTEPNALTQISALFSFKKVE
jgi:hypothetical protein